MAKKNIATFLGTGKHLTIAGNQAFAYSGPVSVNATLTTLISFHTGGKMIKALLVPMYMGSAAEGDDYLWSVTFNGSIVAQLVLANNVEVPNTDCILIVPPLTEVIVQSKNLTENEAHDVGCMFTGETVE